MKITFDPEKRCKTLEERDLDMERAGEVFLGPFLEFPDIRFDYGEYRRLTFGYL